MTMFEVGTENTEPPGKEISLASIRDIASEMYDILCFIEDATGAIADQDAAGAMSSCSMRGLNRILSRPRETAGRLCEMS